MEESILTFEKQYKNSWLGNDDCLKKVCRSVIKGRGRRTSPGRCLTIHYLNQRHACLPSLCATCKYSGRCSTRVDERTGGVCTRLWRRRWWRDVVHPANSIPFLSLCRMRNAPKIRGWWSDQRRLCDKKNLGRVCRVIYSTPVSNAALRDSVASIRIIAPQFARICREWGIGAL